MPKQRYTYEIFLGSPRLSTEDWREFCFQLAKLLGPFACPRLIIRLEEQTFHFYLATYQPLPSSIGLSNFLLKLDTESKVSFNYPRTYGVFLGSHAHGILSIASRLKRKSYQFITLEISLRTQLLALPSATITCAHAEKLYRRHLVLSDFTQILAVDFSRFSQYCYKKFPKYLSSEKILPFLSNSESSDSTILKVDTFPHGATKCYLDFSAFDFDRHSLVLGSSGSGKSRFLSLLIDRIYHGYPEKYKIVLLDPHDALYRDLTTVKSQKLINFSCAAQSLDLFWNPVENIGVAVELLLELFRSIMKDNYNSRLERVLRFSSQLLLSNQSFSFRHLRTLLLDSDYRNRLLSLPNLPSSISEFFLTDFNILKTQSYDLAIAPIIAFLDEVEIVPALNSEIELPNLYDTIEQNFLSIFSLNQLRLGNKMTQTISGLLMQQIFLLAKSGKLRQDVIVIIDEVAVVEHPILQNFLSELRKYRVSVILASQYFDQMSSKLQSAIFANVANYYLFRTSRRDANILTENLDLSLKNANAGDEAKFLAGLNLRECVARLSFGGKLKPAFKSRTLDFLPPPYVGSILPVVENYVEESSIVTDFKFDSTTSISPDELMRENTTNRKKFNGVNYD